MRDWTRQPPWSQEPWANPEPNIKKDFRPIFYSPLGQDQIPWHGLTESGGELGAESPSIPAVTSAVRLRAIRWNDVLGAIRMLFLKNDQRDATENSYGGQDESQGYGLTEKTDTTQGRNDRDTQLDRRSVGGFQRR